MILQPRLLYAEQGRAEEYGAFVERLKGERTEFLSKYPSLTRAIVESVG
jgi:hypothetical protein